MPHASDPSTDLGANTTRHLLADIEALRRHLGVDRWLVLGGSWGSTLGLAYTEQHPDRVSAAVLFSVVTTTRREVEWVTRHVGRLFPEEWSRFRDGVPAEDRDGDLAAAYARLLNDANPRIRERAAEAWCRWEAAHVQTGSRRDPDPRFADPRFRLCFARLVTHYWRHAAWLEDGALLTGAAGLGTVPGFLVHGRLDVSSPLDVPWSLARAWPGSRLEVIDDAGHTGSDRMTQAVRRATASAANPHLPR